MPFNFPNSPTLGQQYTLGSKTWEWNGSAWDAVPIADLLVERAETAAANAAADAATVLDRITPSIVYFSGNGSTTAFTLPTNPGGENNTRVHINAAYQHKTEYSVSGTTLTFSTAPPTGTNNIEVEVGPAAQVVIGVESADNITYTAAGTGAIVSDVEAALNNEVWASGYSTLQQALNTGKLVRLVDGVTYPVTSQLTIPSGGGIVGRGILTFNSTNFTATSKTISALSTVLYALSVDDITLRDFKMVGTCGANSYLFPIGIRDVERANISGIEVTGLNAGSIVMIDSSFDVMIEGCNFHDCQINRTGSTAQLTAVEVDDNRLSSVGSKRISVVRNHITNLTVTPAFLAAYGYQTDGVNIKVGASSCLVADNIMNLIGEGVDLFCDDSIVSSNVILNAYNDAIKLIHGASRNLIIGNRCVSPGRGGVVVAGSNSATQNTDSNVIQGNFISGVNDAGNFTADNTYAVACNNDGTYVTSNTSIIGNHIIDSPGADSNILLGGSGTGNRAFGNLSDGSPASEFSGTNGVGATFMRRGGVLSSNRYEEASDNGTHTVRYDDSGVPIARVSRNYGISASGHGFSNPVYFGTGGAFGDTAADWQILSTASWANASTRSAKAVLNLALAGATTTVATFDPSTGLTLTGALNSNTGRIGGVTTATRYADFNQFGIHTTRSDSASGVDVRYLDNYGITAAGNGLNVLYRYGTGGALGGEAASISVVATDTWALAANRSARYILNVAYQGVKTRVLDADPSVGFQISQSVKVITVGKGLAVKEGANAKQGQAVLVAGSVVVSNTSVTGDSRILLTGNSDGGTPGWLRVSDRTAGVSFTITSSSGTDTSSVAYQIFEPA